MRRGALANESGLTSVVAAFVGVLVMLLVLGFMTLGEPRSDDDPASSGTAAAATSLTSLILEQHPGDGQQTPAERRARHVLSNGCDYSERGIPRCGVLVGAAYGGNTDPLAWEQSMGHPLGVHRTYWASEDVLTAVTVARDDLAHQRLPWLSFKMPGSWEAMRDGAGDAWARNLAQQLSTLDGPVWVAFHHEPEGDGDIEAWTGMQERLAPIVRAAAPNVAFSVILTGWHQLHGWPRYSLDSIWPDTQIDLVGFDVYNKYGVVKNGVRVNDFTDFERDYFSAFSRFAKAHGVAWGLAETGQTDRSAVVEPNWTLRTYLSVMKYGGIAFSYYNSTLNSVAPWRLDIEKGEEFARVLRTTPTL
jgi:hypothetical protein